MQVKDNIETLQPHPIEMMVVDFKSYIAFLRAIVERHKKAIADRKPGEGFLGIPEVAFTADIYKQLCSASIGNALTDHGNGVWGIRQDAVKGFEDNKISAVIDQHNIFVVKIDDVEVRAFIHNKG